MYNDMRNQWEIKTGRKKTENQSTQLKTGIKLMNDNEIIQKIKDSNNLIKSYPKLPIKKEPWIQYIYYHPGQYVFLFSYLFIFFLLFFRGNF